MGLGTLLVATHPCYRPKLWASMLFLEDLAGRKACQKEKVHSEEGGGQSGQGQAVRHKSRKEEMCYVWR